MTKRERWIENKIRKLVGEGKSNKQAVAIALAMAAAKDFAHGGVTDGDPKKEKEDFKKKAESIKWVGGDVKYEMTPSESALDNAAETSQSDSTKRSIQDLMSTMQSLKSFREDEKVTKNAHGGRTRDEQAMCLDDGLAESDGNGRPAPVNSIREVVITMMRID